MGRLRSALVAIVLASSACVACSVSPDASARCRALGQAGVAASVRVRVLVGSRLPKPDLLQPGAIALCDGVAGALFVRLSALHAGLPRRFRPTGVVLHLEPRTGAAVRAPDVIEYHRPSGQLLIDARALSLPDSVWLHELAHVRMRQLLPGSPLGRELMAALEEGIADYYAAALAGDPRLGPFPGRDDGVRDVSRGAAVRAGEWERLAVDPLGFDRHRVGMAFASAAFHRAPKPGPLLEDLLVCMDRARTRMLVGVPAPVDTPAVWLGPWRSACPDRSRAVISELLDAWLPAPLPPPSSLQPPAVPSPAPPLPPASSLQPPAPPSAPALLPPSPPLSASPSPSPAPRLPPAPPPPPR